MITGLDLSHTTGITEIPNGAFSGCAALGSVNGKRDLIIPANVTRIGGKAFWGCKGFQHLKFANGSKLTEIGNNAFAGCSNFEGNLVIPNTVTRIGSSAFQGSYKLPWSSRGDPTTDKALRLYFEGLDIDQRPTTIDGFKEQVAVFLNKSRESFPADKQDWIPSGGFQTSDVQVETGDWHTKIEKDDPTIIHIQVDKIIVNAANSHVIKYYDLATALDYDALNTDLNAPSSPVTLFNAKQKSTITLSSSLITIEADAFKNCNNIIAFENWPSSSLTTIGKQAFQDCSSWAGPVVVPDSVSSIGDEAFDGCDGLTRITVSKDLKLGVGKPEWLPNKKKWEKDDSLSTSSTVVFVPKN